MQKINSDSCPVCGSNESKTWLQAPDRFHGKKIPYQLVRCPSCSLVWLHEPPPPSEMGQHYGPNYDRFIGMAGETSPGRWEGRKKAIAGYKQGGTLMDLGCSSGAFLESLKGQDWELYGIEMSEAQARKAKERSGATIFVGDILDAPFPAETFDVVTCFDVLEHVYQPREVMARVAQWLKPGGIFYVLVPNIDSGEARIFKSYWYGLELPRHISHFSPRSLQLLADLVGLQAASVSAHRNSGLEHSLGYINNKILGRLGWSRPPIAETRELPIPLKVIRKILRWTVFSAIFHATRLAGPGESIHAVFQRTS